MACSTVLPLTLTREADDPRRLLASSFRPLVAALVVAAEAAVVVMEALLR